MFLNELNYIIDINNTKGVSIMAEIVDTQMISLDKFNSLEVAAQPCTSGEFFIGEI